MATDLTYIGEKVSNNGATDAGRLTSDEFNDVIKAVIENQTSVSNLNAETAKSVKSIMFNGQNYRPDENGALTLLSTTSKYSLNAVESYGTTTLREGEDFILSVTPKLTYTDVNEEGVTETTEEKDVVMDIAFYYDTETLSNNVVYSAKIRSSETVSFNYRDIISTSDTNPAVYAKVTHTQSGQYYSTRFINLNIVFLQFNTRDFDNTQIISNKNWILNAITSTPVNIAPTVTLKINDKEFIKQGTAGNSQNISFNINEEEIGTSGVRNLSIFATISVTVAGEVFDIKSDEINLDYIYVNPEDKITTPLIASNLVDNTEFNRYNNLIVPYWIYSSNAVEKTVSLGLYNTDGSVVEGFSTTTVVSFNSSTTGLLRWSIALLGDKSLEGDKIIKITCEDSIKEIPIKIIEPTINLQDTTGYVAYFTASNRSNSDVDSEGNSIAHIWENANSSRPDIKMTFSEHFNFTDGGSGWVTVTDENVDDYGATSLHIKKGDYATLEYKPFERDITWGPQDSTRNGLTFSVEFSTKNCIDKNATVIDCLDENGKGFQIKANSAFISDNKDTYSCEYREGTRIKLDMIISGKQSTYPDPTLENPNNTWTESLVWIFIDGVYQLINNIKQDFSLRQLSPKTIKFGSENCELDIYSIRIYETPLNYIEVLNNYAYDSPVPTEKIAIAQRNNLLTVTLDNEITVEEGKLREARPELPIIKFNMADKTLLPVNKDDWLKMKSMIFYNPLVKDSSLGMASFTTTGSFRNQGSSSMRYPAPYRNYDWKGGKFDFEDGVTGAKKYKLYDSDPGIKKLTFKKDYASSEMANNICCSELFTDMAVGLAGKENRCLSPTMEIAYSKNPDTIDTYRLSLKGTPMFAYYTDANHTKDTPLGMFNFIPNKSEVDYLGFVDKISFTNEEGTTEEVIVNHTHAGYDKITGTEDFIKLDANNFKPLGNVAQSWEIRDNFVFMEDILTPAHYVPTILKEEGKEDTVVYSLTENSSVWMQYEARYPKDSILHWKYNEDGEVEGDGDFGCHSEDTVSVADYESKKDSYENGDDLIKSRQECAEILEFHNWVASTNPKGATGLPLTELYNIYTGKTTYEGSDVNLQKKFLEFDLEGNPLRDEEGNLVSKFARWADSENGYPGWRPDSLVLLNYIDESTGAGIGYTTGAGSDSVFLNDTPEYRRAKFAKEATMHFSEGKWINGGRLRLEQWLLYYIWMEQFWMMDSGSKNLQLYTMGRRLNAPDSAPLEWGCMVRDADTGLGIDNEGKFMFPPYLEDVDFMKDKGALTDREKFEFNTTEKPQGNLAEVLNGQKGVMWKNLRDCFGGSYNSRMGEIYNSLINNSASTHFGLFGDNNTIDKFDSHQSKWSEALYDFGSMQYHGTKDNAAWITSGLGNKKHQRRNWLYYGFRYRMSKYNSKLSGTAMTFKYASSTPTTVQASLYSPLYTRTAATASALDAVNYKRHMYIDETAPILFVEQAGNTMHYLYDSDLYTDLGNLYEIGGASEGIASLTFENSGGTRLRSLRLGNRDDLINYQNNQLFDALVLDSLVELQTLDLSSCIIYDKPLNLANQIQLENLYCENTRIPSVTLPKTSSLKEVWLPTSVNSIKLEDLPNLKTNNITAGIHTKTNSDSYTLNENWSNVKELTITNCPNINSLTLLNKVINNKLTTLKINNINWNLSDKSADEIQEFFKKILAISNLNLSGVIDCGNVYNALTYEIKLGLAKAFGNIDDVNNGLHIKYSAVLPTNKVSESNIIIDDTLFIGEEGSHSIDFSIVESVINFKIENGGVKTSWSIIELPEGYEATDVYFADSTKNTITVNKTGDGITNKPTVIVNLTVFNNEGGAVVKTLKVNVYNKLAKPGDIVCADGNFYSPEEYEFDINNPPVGICYYAKIYTIDGKQVQKRLMASRGSNFMSSLSNPLGNTGGYNASTAFGPSDINNFKDEYIDNIYIIPGLDDTQRATALQDIKMPDGSGVANLVGLLKNKDSIGLTYYFNRSGNKITFNEPSTSELIGQIGFIELSEKDVELLGGDYKVGDLIPFGKRNTLLVLKHRNSILNNEVYSNLGMKYPQRSAEKSKLGDALELFVKNGIFTKSGSNSNPDVNDRGWLYFPIFTVADCYHPFNATDTTYNDIKLNEKFTEGNWFVPAIGDLLRLKYYSMRTFTGNNIGVMGDSGEECIDGTDLTKTTEKLYDEHGDKISDLNWAKNANNFIHSSSVMEYSNSVVPGTLFNMNGTTHLSSLGRHYRSTYAILCCEF